MKALSALSNFLDPKIYHIPSKSLDAGAVSRHVWIVAIVSESLFADKAWKIDNPKTRAAASGCSRSLRDKYYAARVRNPGPAPEKSS